MNMNYVNIITLALTLNVAINNVVQANQLELNTTIPVNNDVAVKAQTMANESVITTQTSAAKIELMAKLANLHHFSAKFDQQVQSESGDILEQSSGKLAISKPNLANWHTAEPDELLIVSDGENVWFYNPWIEQVSVYSLSAAIAQTPILLLTSQDEAMWQEYSVTNEEDNSFVITAKDVNSQIKSLTLLFDTDKAGGKLKQFSFLDATGQLSHIKLSDFDDHTLPEANLFNFVVPEGVQIDDQRAN
ncbi:outer membrane lipoprotein chaperone LolA [Colwellia sp. 1_MG-2023]|uniref:outer membrane lipoprotein chaperone LolA n=1 Tax=unclassified Colwellia TaxID=196834 RepID=UPI001C08CCE5|nr:MULTISPECIES: outer membrane lipoprotein chaperone LolA [unclassified Colwellia]MBU2926077.1 outer membrane lipoprotein chaperone LolA [Colwellia sp. C2M11]MDO6653218.1 outer membrane lipoprotein chaperone LolA [Colwellia sp. 3_MG-2023]MDO6666029.1 outer membrane lipoprotein chaperone LolA [Colwellia sp. 2_MG-2023]MDO6690485.1 outer membrane lipoprotein chaperone LolA [Colwellia sp. 1_MG-2023]